MVPPESHRKNPATKKISGVVVVAKAEGVLEITTGQIDQIVSNTRNQTLMDCIKIAESFKRFANHNPHCQEIADEIRSKIGG